MTQPPEDQNSGYGNPYMPPPGQYAHYSQAAQADMTKGRLSGTNKTWLIVIGSIFATIMLCCVGTTILAAVGSANAPSPTATR